MVSATAVSITVLFTTATSSTAIAFSFITAFSLITLSSAMESSSGAASLIPIMGIPTTHIILTPTVVTNPIVKITIEGESWMWNSGEKDSHVMTWAVLSNPHA